MGMAAEVPAVVVGAGINGLGVARSLASAGVPTWILDPNATRVGMYSRAARPLLLPTADPGALVDGLLNVQRKYFRRARPVLILTQEDDVKTVSEHRETLEPAFRFLLSGRDLLRSLMHKESFHRLAEHEGAPVPRLVHIRELGDCLSLRQLRFPVVLKPGERNAAYSREFKKAYRLETPEEAEELVHRILAVMPDIVVQEWIDGPDASIYFCLQFIVADGSVVASFVGRKIRSWPPRVGGTASCMPAPEVADKLGRMTTGFFQAVGATGFVAMEYKLDVCTGHFVMVEPTVGRTDYQAEVSTLNGVNLPFAAYCSQIGRSAPPPVVGIGPIVWRDGDADRKAAADQGQRRSGRFPRGAVVRDAIWRWRDPMPFVMTTFHRLLNSATRRISRIAVQAHRKGSW